MQNKNKHPENLPFLEELKRAFEKYLLEQKLRESTIRGHLQDLVRFKKWCDKENIHCNKAGYNELLKFIRETRARGVSKSSINLHLNSISKYYDYLTKSGERNDNPGRELRLKNNGKKVLQNLLTPEELEEIYMNYINIPQWKFKGEKSKQSHRRNIVILGLMIYQGIYTPEIRKIEKAHLNLLQGAVYIPSAGRSNSRILKLQARQIIPMQQYLQAIEANQEKLVVSGVVSEQSRTAEPLFNRNISSIAAWLMTILRKQSEKIKDAQQIRSSVIINWLKQYNIRQVQYMAGHRHISSTEKYKQEDLQDLQKQVDLYHPLTLQTPS